MAKVAKPVLPPSFEAGLLELEGLVAALENSELPLEESLAAYRRGSELVQFCQGKLDASEQQIRILEGETLQPFPSTATPTAN